ncbi:histidine phosphatase superfamily [Neohortaea acidophila]|uniref:Histidine phosphatase superfamily n=1 Tax=Neohortaea acidophila TaxID=245834 RepID=A0A6A6PGG2_9PEZI|nr:histidine phosphatase superfamily [Neohortaea acidophila]KAF2479078.1 histidine phosphatase superfamily [Neohortaea acidophila]
MKLYLIRHGETVDNVAGVYAGSRDSALTNHGFEQAKRLGSYFAENDVKFTHIFASPLSRAFRTAGAVKDAQTQLAEPVDGVDIVKVQELIERDYGAYEGRPYSTRSEWQKTGKDGVEESGGSVESVQSMAKRSDRFLDEHFLPLFDEDRHEEYIVAIVAHGMLCSHLWRRLLLRLPRRSLKIAPEIVAARGNIVLEHLGGWSNTGYLELSIRREAESRPEAKPISDGSYDGDESASATTLSTPVPPPVQSEGADVSLAPPKPSEPASPRKKDSRELSGYSTTILAIDSKQHLVGLKRQPGGIGSLANDKGQKKLDTFFKREKAT